MRCIYAAKYRISDKDNDSDDDDDDADDDVDEDDDGKAQRFLTFQN